MDPNTCAALFLAAGAAWMDLKKTEVDNGWLLFWLAAGAAVQVIRAGPGALLPGLAGMAVPLFLLFPLFYFRMLGAGDIKTLAVLGSLVGHKAIFPCLFYTFLFGAVLSAGVFLLYGGFRSRLQYLAVWLRDLLQTGQRQPYLRPGVQEENLHMTIPILMAVLLRAGSWY